MLIDSMVSGLCASTTDTHSADETESAKPSTHSTRAAGIGVSATVARNVAAKPPSLPHNRPATS
jgi:hypothetical protein